MYIFVRYFKIPNKLPVKLITFLVSFIVASSSFASVNPQELHFTILQGESLSFQIISQFQDPVVAFSPQNGIVEEMEAGGQNLFDITYTADSNFSGEDVFSLQTLIFTNGFFPTPEMTVVYVTVLNSNVKAFDDFVTITDEEIIEVFPLENDFSNTDSHILLGITNSQYGIAEVTDSSSIIYTSSEQDLDFIQYSIIDSLGTSSQGVIYIKKDVAPVEELSLQYSIGNNTFQYIFLDDDDFVASSNLELGTVETINDKVFKYIPNPKSTGVENLYFTDTEGNEVFVEINIYDVYEDQGIVRDDIVFTQLNDEVIFDVLDNDFDNSLIIDEENSSQELEYLGNGQFSFVPEEGYEGKLSFFYTASNGFKEETGSIDLIVSDFTPVSAVVYDFATLEGSVLSLDYDAPLKGYTFEVLSSPTFGVISFIDNGEIVSTVCGDIVANKKLLYTPFDGYEGMDEFDIQYCVGGRCTILKTSINVLENADDNCLCLEDCIWPGDTNNDGQVNISDILSIGRYLGQGGEERVDESPWSGGQTNDWVGTSNYNVNNKYADANGDGLVSDADIDVVINNFGKSHTYHQQTSLGVKDYPFSMVPRSTNVALGETMYIDFFIGNEDYPVVDLSGISFGININPNTLDSSSVKMTYHNDGFLVNQAPYIDVTHQIRDGLIRTAAIKTNQIGSTGFGIIATLEFIVEEEVDGVRHEMSKRASNGNLLLEQFIDLSNITIESGDGFRYTLVDQKAQFEIEIEDKASDDSYNYAYPNPASSVLNLSIAQDVERAVLLDVNGRLIGSYNQSQQVDIRNLSTGMYVVRYVSETKTTTQKIQIIQ